MGLKKLRLAFEKLINIKEEEASLTFYSFAYFFFLLSGYYILRPLRDEMGIQGGVEHLQWLFTGTFLAMLTAVPIYSWFVSKFPRRKFLPLIYRFFILNILIFWALFHWHPGAAWTARAFFIWTSTFNLFIVSVFWSFMVDIFSKESAKRLFGFIAAGGSAGALVGPLLTIGLLNFLGPINLLLVSAFLLEMAVFCIRKIIRRPGEAVASPLPIPAGEKSSAIGGSAWSGILAVARSPYLLAICLYIFLLMTCNTFLYFIQAHIVSDTLGLPHERLRIFASIDLFVNIFTLGIQLFLTGRIILGLGLPAALALMPGLMLSAFTILALKPLLFLVALFQVARRVFEYAITRPSREILFTVVSDEEKYKSKNFIDTVISRGGDALSAWGFAGLLAAGLSLPIILMIAASLALLWLITGIGLGKVNNRIAESRNSKFKKFEFKISDNK